MEMKKLWLFIVVSFIAGFIWGCVFRDILPYRYSCPKIPKGKYERMVSVDVIKESDEILIYEHYSRELVFEYNKNKDEDKSAYKEFEDILIEMKSLR